MLLEYIDKLRNESFECWSEDAKNGYLTALKSVEEKFKSTNPSSPKLPEFSEVNKELGKWFVKQNMNKVSFQDIIEQAIIIVAGKIGR